MTDLPPHWILHCFDRVDSTNTVAAEMAARGAPEGTVVMAKSQSAGRGRWGRTWESPLGKNLYISVILRPKLLPRQVAALALVAGLSAAEVLRQGPLPSTQLKWPNDLWVNGRKLGGVLSELSLKEGQVDHVIVGLGLNVNSEKSDFSETIAGLATSLALETGRSFEMDALAHQWCHSFYRRYQQFLNQGFPALQADYTAVMALLGEMVQVEGTAETIAGKIHGVDAQGWLQLLQPDGTITAIDAGEVIKVCCS